VNKNFTALVAVNNTPVVALAGRVHADSSWPCDSLPVSLDITLTALLSVVKYITVMLRHTVKHACVHLLSYMCVHVSTLHKYVSTC